MSIRVGIFGYGNLGKGVELAVAAASDMTTVGVFTRRDPKTVQTVTGVPVFSMEEMFAKKEEIDVLVLCGGSATDLPNQTPALAEHFNVVDSFDTHAKIPQHVQNVHEKASIAGKTAMVSIGWDPGMFSLSRLYANAILPQGKTYTFWGEGVSQGHSDAIRRIEGVADAKQYTVPVQAALDALHRGETPDFTTRQKHTRKCFVVAKEGADKARIEREIKTMPNYFDEYDTTVYFISQEELNAQHAGLPHGGRVIHSGKTGTEQQNKHVIEYVLKLDSNPEFTASVLVAFARAAYRLNKEGVYGCKTIFDVPPIYLIQESREEVLAKLL